MTNQLDISENKQLWKNLIDHYCKQTERPYANFKDDSFYFRMALWLREEENCHYLSNKNILYFKDERKLTLFVLKWS